MADEDGCQICEPAAIADDFDFSRSFSLLNSLKEKRLALSTPVKSSRQRAASEPADLVSFPVCVDLDSEELKQQVRRAPVAACRPACP
jgi:hypothetical protein